RHTVRRLEPRTFLTALNSQKRTPHGRVPRRRIGVQGGIISRNWCKPLQHKRRYPPAPVLFFGRYRETATYQYEEGWPRHSRPDCGVGSRNFGRLRISHLAGAMGKPVWILLAPTRDPEDNPWYPTAFFAPAADGRRLEGRH